MWNGKLKYEFRIRKVSAQKSNVYFGKSLAIKRKELEKQCDQIFDFLPKFATAYFKFSSEIKIIRNIYSHNSLGCRFDVATLPSSYWPQCSWKPPISSPIFPKQSELLDVDDPLHHRSCHLPKVWCLSGKCRVVCMPSCPAPSQISPS